MAILIGIIILSRIAAGYPGEDERFPNHDPGSEVYDNNAEEAPKFRGWDPEDVLGTLKRFKNNSQALDSKASDLEDVKGALKEILSGRNVEELFTFVAEDTTHTHATSRSHRRFGKMIDPETNDDTTAPDEQELSTITATRSKHTLQTMEKIEEETLKIEVETDIAEPFYRKQEKYSTRLGATPLIIRAEDIQELDTNRLGLTPLVLRQYGDTTSTTITAETTTTTTIPLCYTTTSTTSSTILTTTTPEPKLDIPALMDIISNFTYDWLSNLTRSVNETLLKKGIPTCPELTTPTPLTTYGENMTGTLMGKCFFCGLDEVGLPRRAYCADAFAGDFLPLMPVEAKARSMLSKYRKYCRYKNKHPYYMDRGDTRSVWGAWTGGCAVRWIDLSGIYTQRTCRIRTRPLLGKHYGSKRMAKLELALQNVDNGCIISPMASLVPLSRGISLYARFHACVCTGYWCNRATVSQPWTLYIAIMSMCVIAKDFIIIC